MDKETRNKIRNTILEIRRLLEVDISDQLEGIYGIARSGKAQPVEGMLTLRDNPVLRYQREQIDAALGHERDAGLTAKQAVEQFIHETSYTALNRLVAVKMLEARSLLTRTAVSDGRNSAGFKDFKMVAPQVCQSQADGGYQLFLELLFDELAASIRPLFDRRGAHSIIFPRWTALDQVIRLLNTEELAAIWQEDETIGWVYQYFNTPDREKVRKGGRPRRPQDVAVINQFYTPRYVVEFLVDNTLGRLWYEMRHGDTRLVETCRMLVRRPDEKPGEHAYKDPAEIKILDPAVGSGHFLHYAFDLLAIMYQEAGYSPGDIPALILQNNLHGIDIDPRAAQLAAFTLYLRARAHEIAQGAPAQASLPTANIVVAEPMPGDKRFFEEFLSEQPVVVRNVCRKVWDLLELAAETGSLLKVEMAFDEAIASERARLKKEPLFDVEKLADNNVFWEELKGRIVGLFHDYYRHALGQADLSRILFAAEGEQGFRLLDLLRQDYDVVLMNPPYGDTTDTAREYLEDSYSDTKNDLYAAFIERSLAFLRASGGYVGAITSRTFMFLSSFKKLRENVIFPQAQMSPVADLGFGVLDTAMVETVAFGLKKGNGGESIFFRLLKEEEKEYSLHRCLLNLTTEKEDKLTHFARQETFSLIPGSPMAYWVSDKMRLMFTNLPHFSECADVQHGLSTKNDSRFLRLFWEEKPQNIGIDSTWALFAKGGEYSPYYDDIYLVVKHENNFQEIREELLRKYPYLKNNTDWVIHPESFYFVKGLTFPRSTVKGFNVRILPKGCIFADKGLSIFGKNAIDDNALLGHLNSRLVETFLLMQTPSRGWEKSYVENIPFPSMRINVQKIFSSLATECYLLKRTLDQVNEISHVFIRPALLNLLGGSNGGKSSQTNLEEDFLLWLFTRETNEHRIIENSYRIDKTILDIYEISERDRNTIDRELGSHPGSYPHKDDWSQDDDEKLRLLYLTKDALPEERDEEDDQEDDDSTPNKQRRSRRTTYRTLEEIAHELKIHPASIAARRQALGLYRPEEFTEAVADLISYCVGCLFSRWDIRIGAGELEPPPLPDPEDGLPLYPSGTLHPDSPPLEDKGALTNVLEHTAMRGLLVDDPGHQHDLVASVESCLSYLFGEEKLPAIRSEIEEALGRDLRAWLGRNFFPFHVKRYSKSRRKAPIYWQLSTPSKGYSLWLYYHAIGADTLYTAVREYVSPKIKFEEDRLAELKSKFERLKTSRPAREARSAEKAIEDQESFLQELYAFRSELQRLADWGYSPDLNDGVIINIAPLHRLVPWREAEKYWEKLILGEYEWSSMAGHISRMRGEGNR